MLVYLNGKYGFIHVIFYVRMKWNEFRILINMMQLVLAANWRMNMECRGTSWPSPVGPPLLLLVGLDSGPGKNRLQRFIEQPLFGDSTQLYILTALPGIGGINRSQCNMLVWQSKTYHPVKQHRPCQIGGWKVSFHYKWAIFRVYVDRGEGKKSWLSEHYLPHPCQHQETPCSTDSSMVFTPK